MGCLHVPRDLLSHNVFLSTYILYSTIYTMYGQHEDGLLYHAALFVCISLHSEPCHKYPVSCKGYRA